MDDDFVFETLWFGRNSFVLSSGDRALAMLGRFNELLTERRKSRAHTLGAVHVVWDTALQIPEAALQQFAALGRATGCTLLLCPKRPARVEADT